VVPHADVSVYRSGYFYQFHACGVWVN
jgi:hypothetical protein